jgi:hypothetical protein
MTDDLVKSVLFYFACASLDVFFTTVVLCTGIGIEGNPLWNWITPMELMLVVCVLANLLFCLFIFAIIPYLKRRHVIYQMIVKCGLYGEGLGRLAFGAVPGILLMKGAGWF